MLTLEEQHQHLLLFYFGPGGNPVKLCVNRAYRDVNRTMHGLSALPAAGKAGHDYLYDRLQELGARCDVKDQADFDAWHERTCFDLICTVRAGGYEKMYIGQAQKWINMALKYLFVFSRQDLPEFAKVFPWCHIPIDNIILNSDAFKPAPKLRTSWSRMADYSIYLAFQRWVRQAFPGQAPLAVEFEVWAKSQTGV